MVTPNLFDVITITGLRPTGETLTPILEIINEFVFDQYNFKSYITDHHNTTTEKVSDQEHITFLTLWISYYFFVSSSLQIAKNMFL